MESKELMLGNWVKYAHNSFWIEEIQGQPVQIDIDNYQEIYFDEGGTPKYEPIVITPEILEMAGFEKDLIDVSYPEDGYYHYMGLSDETHCDLSFISCDKNGIVEVGLFPYEGYFRMQYLHQLQNLYFALTGSHLKIELK